MDTMHTLMSASTGHIHSSEHTQSSCTASLIYISSIPYCFGMSPILHYGVPNISFQYPILLCCVPNTSLRCPQYFFPVSHSALLCPQYFITVSPVLLSSIPYCFGVSPILHYSVSNIFSSVFLASPIHTYFRITDIHNQ